MPTFMCEKCGRDFFADYDNEDKPFVFRSGGRLSEEVNNNTKPVCTHCGAAQKEGKFSFPI